MAAETQLPSNYVNDDQNIDGEADENGDLKNGIDEELDDALFDDPEGFVDEIADEGIA